MQTARPRTDPRVTRTRRLIEKAFFAALEEKGFEGLSVQDVASKAGINRVTFYSHFTDKYALLRYWIRGSLSSEIEHRELCSRRLDEESVSELFRLLCGYVSSARDHCKPPHEQLNWLLETEIRKLSAEIIEEWLTGSASDPHSGRERHRLAAVAAGAAMYGLVEQWLRSDEREPAEHFIAASRPLVMAILGI